MKQSLFVGSKTLLWILKEITSLVIKAIIQAKIKIIFLSTLSLRTMSPNYVPELRHDETSRDSSMASLMNVGQRLLNSSILLLGAVLMLPHHAIEIEKRRRYPLLWL